MSVEVDLGVDKIKVLRRGKWQEIELDKGVYKTELNAGEADFIIVE